jgi:hypothetical protein
VSDNFLKTFLKITTRRGGDMSLLKITDLKARIEGDGREILKGINLEI